MIRSVMTFKRLNTMFLRELMMALNDSQRG